jgi:aromatic ring-opening dioxygenase catalytic subunit (LigB family)
MARIVGGIGCSHAPALAGVFDSGGQDQPMWKPIFDGFAAARAWLEHRKPDLVLIAYNDHLNHFFFDSYPTFALGVADSFPLADEGRATRNFTPLPGHPAFAWHLARSLVEDEFDPTICQEMPLDHGVMAPLPLLLGHPWTIPVVPLAVNVIQHPLPTARRCFRLGQAIGRAIASFPDDLDIVVLGTGGLSHQLHGPDFGTVNPDWDLRFLDELETDPAALAALSHAEYMRQGGAEAVEMIIWLIMRGALGGPVTRVTRTYDAPALTGLAVTVLAPGEAVPPR